MRFSITVTSALIASAFAMAQIPASTQVFAQGAILYEIAANDGYGLEECLNGAEACGQTVADAWCDAHGHGKALEFGRSSRAAKAVDPSESYTVSCSE